MKLPNGKELSDILCQHGPGEYIGLVFHGKTGETNVKKIDEITIEIGKLGTEIHIQTMRKVFEIASEIGRLGVAIQKRGFQNERMDKY